MAKRTSPPLRAAVACAVLGTLAAARPLTARAQGNSDDPEAARARVATQTTLAFMESASAHARLVLRRARTSRDARATSCADEALTRADVALRIARDHAGRAAAAWSQGDREHARFEAGRVTAGAEMARGAVHDADACIAPARAQADPAPRETFAPNDVTVVRMVVDPSLPGDVTGYPNEPR